MLPTGSACLGRSASLTIVLYFGCVSSGCTVVPLAAMAWEAGVESWSSPNSLYDLDQLASQLRGSISSQWHGEIGPDQWIPISAPPWSPFGNFFFLLWVLYLKKIFLLNRNSYFWVKIENCWSGWGRNKVINHLKRHNFSQKGKNYLS